MKLSEMVKSGKTFDTADYGTVLAQPQRDAKGRATRRINLVTMDGDVPAVFDRDLATSIEIEILESPARVMEAGAATNPPLPSLIYF